MSILTVSFRHFKPVAPRWSIGPLPSCYSVLYLCSWASHFAVWWRSFSRRSTADSLQCTREAAQSRTISSLVSSVEAIFLNFELRFSIVLSPIAILLHYVRWRWVSVFNLNTTVLFTLCATDQCMNVGALPHEVDISGVRPLIKWFGHVEPWKSFVRVDLQVCAILVHG